MSFGRYSTPRQGSVKPPSGCYRSGSWFGPCVPASVPVSEHRKFAPNNHTYILQIKRTAKNKNVKIPYRSEIGFALGGSWGILGTILRIHGSRRGFTVPDPNYINEYLVSLPRVVPLLPSNIRRGLRAATISRRLAYVEPHVVLACMPAG